MNKSELITAVQQQADCTKAEAAQQVDNVLAAIKQGLIQDKEVTLPEFGKFEVKDTAERQGRNPKTGEPMTIPARQQVKFSPYTKLKDAVQVTAPS